MNAKVTLRIFAVAIILGTFVWMISTALVAIKEPIGHWSRSDSWLAAIATVIPVVPPFAWYMWVHVTVADDLLRQSRAFRDAVIAAAICVALSALSLESAGALIGASYFTTWIIWAFTFGRYRKARKSLPSQPPNLVPPSNR